VGRAGILHMLDDVGAVALGIAFPCLFFILAAAGAIEDETAFTIAKWSGSASSVSTGSAPDV
jgi:hypothetical protein